MNSFSTSFKAFALVALLSVLNVNAMEDTKATPPNTTIPSNPPAQVNTDPAPEIKPQEKTVVRSGISNAWGNVTKAITDNPLVKAVTDMKTRGWSKWSSTEKFGFVFGGTVAVCAAVFAGCKIYEYYTTPAKTKVKKARA